MVVESLGFSNFNKLEKQGFSPVRKTFEGENMALKSNFFGIKKLPRSKAENVMVELFMHCKTHSTQLPKQIVKLPYVFTVDKLILHNYNVDYT